MENKKVRVTICIVVLLGASLSFGYLFGSPQGQSLTHKSLRVYIPEERGLTEQVEEAQAIEQIALESGLTTIAREKIKNLETTGYWSHTNSNGCSFRCRVRSYLATNGGRYSWIGENLYKGTCDVDNAYRLWELSPAHNEVLKHGYDEQVLLTGKYGGSGCYYVLIKGVVK